MLNDLLLDFADSPAEEPATKRLQNIVREVGFLFQNDVKTRDTLQEIVQVCTRTK